MKSLTSRQTLANEIIRRLRQQIPDPRCELYHESPYQLLVSVVLSANTTDAQVNKAMRPLYEAGFTPQTVLGWGPDGLLARIRSIGLAPTKSKNVHRLTETLVSAHDGIVPSSREALEALPGVGRKTANVVLAEIYQHPTLAVDTHVFRVSTRLGLQDAKTPEKAELELLKVVDASHLPAAHHLFILHGRYTCKAVKPLCTACVLAEICPSKHLFVKDKAGPKVAKSKGQKAPSKRSGRARAKR